MAEVFISYARKDKEFVQKLSEALAAQNHEAWIDWKDIPLTAEWQQEIFENIEVADNFVFIISPESIASVNCRREIDHAATNNKRMIPILYRAVPDVDIPEILGRFQRIDFSSQDGFDENLVSLITALNTDLVWTKAHTRLLTRAKEWEREENDNSFLLRGKDWRDAEQWLAESGQSEPKPTILQSEYILASRRYLIKRRRIMIASLIIAVILAGFILLQENAAQRRARQAKARELARAATEGLGEDPERSVLLGMYAVNATLQFGQAPVRDAEDALHEAISSSYVRKTFHGIHGRVAFSPDGKRIAAAGSDYTAQVWDVAVGRELLRLQGHLNAIEDVAFSPDGKRIATASDDRTAKIWDAVSGQELLTLRGHSDRVEGVAFSPESKRIATASDDRTAKIWDAISGRDLLTLRGHSQGVSGLAFSPDGKRVATASNDQTIKVWDAVGGRLLLTLQSHSAGFIRVVFSTDGKRIAAGGFDNTARVWDGSGGHQLLSVGEPGLVESVAFSPDGKLLANSSGHTVKIRDSGTGRELLTLRGHSGDVTSVAFCPETLNGERLATAGEDGTVRIWDLSGREFSSLGDVQLMSSSSGAAFSPDGTRVVTIDSLDQDNKARVWDTVSGHELFSLRSDEGSIFGVATFSPDGKHIASSGSDPILWDGVSGRKLLTLQGHLDVVHDVVFSPNGKRIATASDDRTAKVWDASTGQELLTLRHSAPVYGVSFSPDSKHIATAGDDRTAKVWDASTGQELLTLRGLSTSVEDVTFSPDGKRIATVSRDTTQVWDAAGGKELLSLASTGSIAFSPDGNRLAVMGRDNSSVTEWDSHTGEELLIVSGLGMASRIAKAEQFDPNDLYTGFHSNGPAPAATREPVAIGTSVAYSRDGGRLAIVTGDGTIMIYAVNVRDLLTVARGRVTRDLTSAECKRYFQTDKCPPPP